MKQSHRHSRPPRLGRKLDKLAQSWEDRHNELEHSLRLAYIQGAALFGILAFIVLVLAIRSW